MKFDTIEQAQEEYLKLETQHKEKTTQLETLTKEKEEKDSKIKELQELNQRLFVRLTSEEQETEKQEPQKRESKLNYNIREWK